MVPRFEFGAETRPSLLLANDAGPDAGAVAGTYTATDAAADATADTSAVASTLASTHTRTVPGAYPGTDAVARPGEGRKDVLCGRSRRPGRDGRRRCRTVDSRWFICFVQKRKYQQYARDRTRRRPSTSTRPTNAAAAAHAAAAAAASNLVDDNDLEADFEERDYADETMGDEAKKTADAVASTNSVTSYVARRKAD